MISDRQLSRTILQATADLASNGYGRLRIRCYIKEGIGAWRHQLFTSDTFDGRDEPATELFSLPGWPIVLGADAQEVSAAIIKSHPQVLDSAKGPPTAYSAWLNDILTRFPEGVIEIEEIGVVTINGKTHRVPLPGNSGA